MNDVHDEIDALLKKRTYKEIDEKLNIKEKPLEIKKPALETIQEQIESPMTTTHSPQAVADKELKKIPKNPENYLEINFIKRIRIVDSFFIPSNIKNFTYNHKTYNINEENIYILPTKKGYFMPTCFYKEDIADPVDFRQKNNSISGKALSLLYMPKVYIDLFYGEEGKYNIFIVILLCGSISCYIVGLYFLLGGSM